MKSSKDFLLLNKEKEHVGSAVVLRVIILIAVFATGIICTLGSGSASSRAFYQSKQTAKHARTCGVAELQTEINDRNNQIKQHDDKIDKIYPIASARAQQKGYEGYLFTATERKIIREARENIKVLEAERNSYYTELKSRSDVPQGCFSAKTHVLTEKGSKPITDVKIGDTVLTVDSRGNPSLNHVVKTYEFTNNHYYLINGEIKVTQLHRFFTSNGWKRARDLQLGDLIQTSKNSFVKIHSKGLFRENLKVYNLEIADNHNFFVSADGKLSYLVHNTGGGGGK